MPTSFKLRPDKDKAMKAERYVVMTVECTRCKAKQKIHVADRPGFGRTGDERVACIKCDLNFKLSVPDRIVGGPFPT